VYKVSSYIIVFILLIISSLFFSCRKDQLLTDPSAKLSFSADSILYDTVFTAIGSTTRNFRVYNPNSQPVNVSSIRLANGQGSFFRLNVDGVPGKAFSDIEIPAKDSIYVFVEVTIDPTTANNPFIYTDNIVFETNGNVQNVELVAFGQNAYYHYPKQCIYFSGGGSLCYDTLGCGSVWNNDKPHVVYGYAVVDSACSLTVNAGTRVYFHQNAGLWVYRYGEIHVLGTAAQPVTFQGDRREPEYADEPGQWDRIWIMEGGPTNKNEIDYAIIKNSFIGIQAEYSFFPWATAGERGNLKLTNTTIQNCSGIGLLARYYEIQGGNNLIDNCGSYALAIQYGGQYSFRHCTFANYWTKETRNEPAVFFNNYSGSNPIAFDSLYFGNCILYGNQTNEVEFDSTSTAGNMNNLFFINCVLRTQMNTSSFHYVNCQINQFPGFVNGSAYDFHINSTSTAKDAGSIPIGQKFTTDLDGYNRLLDAGPDIGAYEWH